MPRVAEEFTIGIEEEFLIVDAATRAPVPAAPRLVSLARDAAGDHVHPELQLEQLEVSTKVCETLADVREETIRLRRLVAAAARELGAELAASGSHPFADPSVDAHVTAKEPYLHIRENYRRLADEQLICGCHVHIGIPDAEEAIQVMNRVRPWLSPLIALAANSPFWLGAETGYASYRTEIWRRWPTAGTPEVFASRAEYDHLVEVLIETGSIDAPARIYWDVRPSARFSTLEFRVTDVCLTVDEVVMVAGLVRGLARACHAQVLAGDPLPLVRPELLRAATWRAARYGIEGDLLDVTAGRAAPAEEVLRSLLALERPFLEDAGEWDEVSALVGATLTRGNGAMRQRQVHARTGRLEEVVAFAVAETLPRGTGTTRTVSARTGPDEGGAT